MVFHIAVCSPDAALRSGLERQCMEYFARRQDACIVQQLPDADALLRRDTEGERFDLYLIELGAVAAPAGLSAAAELRRRGRRAPLAFAARTPAHAYSAFRVDAMQYLLLPVHQQELSALEAKGMPQLTMDNIARVIEMWTKIPASKIKEEEFKRLSQLEDRLKQHIVGQDEAVSAVSAAIRRSRVGISPKHKPVSFIFVGSTGVGKTELVKQLAADLFNTPDALIRLDMSEFMEKHSVSRLVGSPPGYVGYDEAGQLTEKIRRKPYSVILFDEIEKAHPDVLNILLQILDDGEITDAHGRKVNFENTVIVMTSNAGSDKAAGSVGFGRSADDQGRERTMKALREFLRPEFINRVDEIVYFHQLSEENFTAIARIMLNELQASLKEKGYSFSYDDALVSHLVHSSYSAAYGARNLRRCIQKELEDPMAVQIIDSFEHPITQLRATAEDGKVRLDTL